MPEGDTLTSTPTIPASSLGGWASACEAVSRTPSKKEKVQLVAASLASLPLGDAALAAVFFTGRPFPRAESKVLGVGGSLLWAAVARAAGTGPAGLGEVYRRHGDLGAMAEELFRGRTSPGLSLHEARKAFDLMASRRGPAPKVEILVELLGGVSPLEAKYLVKLVTGEMRIGLQESLVEEAIAEAFGRPLVAVQRANMLLGDVGAVVALAAEDRLDAAEARLFRPLAFMLARAAETAAEAMSLFPEGALVEDKYDGIRAQAHVGGGEARIFSRTLDEVTEFGELLRPLRALKGPVVLDGEIVAWREGRPLPFTVLQQRLGRKQADLWLEADIPVRYVVFDVLWEGGTLLLDQPLSERRARLTSLLADSASPGISLAPARSCSSPEELQGSFEGALERGNEGIVAKGPGTAYRPGRRGQHWVKLKRPLATLDVVVTAVELGHGKRHGVLSDYTFAVRDGDRLVTLGKAFTGLTDAEILRLTARFVSETLEDRGFLRTVRPSVVIEVAFNNIQRSERHESGFALRFPRILRVRDDKPVSEIDTLDRVREIQAREARKASGG